MTTRDTIQRYFDDLQHKADWPSHLADDVEFTSNTSPARHVRGRDAYLKATQRFYATIRSVEVRDLMVDGDRACALTHYELQPPNGAPSFASDVAEVFSVTDGRIASFDIYFDSAPFPK